MPEGPLPRLRWLAIATCALLALAALGAAATRYPHQPREAALFWGVHVTLAAGVIVLIFRAREAAHRSRLARERLDRSVLLDQVSDALIVLDPDGTIREVNARAGEMYRYGRRLVGLPITALAPREEPGAVAGRTRHVERALEARQLFEAEHRRADGTLFPVEVSASAIDTGSGRSVLCLVRDISERREASARISRLNSLMRTLTEVNQAIAREPDAEKVLREACRIAVDVGGFRLAWIGRAEPDGRIETVATAFADDMPWDAAARSAEIRWDDTPNGQGSAGRSIREGRTMTTSDSVNDPKSEPWRDLLRTMGLRSTASSPIRAGSRIFGTFSLGAGEARFFDEAGTELLEELASDVGFALQAIEDRAARQANEAALAEQQRLFQRVADLTPALLYLFDLETGRSVYLNGRAVELLASPGTGAGGVAVEEVLRRMHPDDRATVPRWSDRFLQAGDEMVESEYRLRDVNGAWRWLHSQDVVFARAADGRPRLVLGAAQDITVRRLAEEALRKSEAQFRAVFDSAAAGIVICTIDGALVRANAAFCRMLGYASEEIEGRQYDEISDADDMAREAPLFEEVRSGARPSYTIDKRYIAKDGRIVWARLTISIIRDAPGARPYVLALIDDITERRLLQEQFQQSQKMESIGRLAGGVAHDFNNLLTAIMGYAEMLRADLPADHPGQAFVDEISKAGSRAASLTTQLLAFARRQVISPRALDLNGVVNETEQMLRRIIGEDIALDVQLQSPLGTVHADVGQLQQILLNLTVNARDAMPHGGRIVIETANTRLDDVYARTHPDIEAGDYVMLVFSDTGAGMPRDVQEHAFEPFFTTKERGKGTGLGLATCHGIVKQAGGHIHVYSEPGLGTTFRIYLPRVPDAVARETLAAPLPPLRRGHETVLLAEDEPAVRNLASLSLRAHGYTVIEAQDGASALTAAHAHAGRIRLLVTDVVMPGMSGPDLAQRFRPLCPEALVLFISGHAESAIVHHGVLDPGVAFLPKPFTPERLARRVREMLDLGVA